MPTGVVAQMCVLEVAARWLDYGYMCGRERALTEHFQMALVAIGLLVSGERCDTIACHACHLKRT